MTHNATNYDFSSAHTQQKALEPGKQGTSERLQKHAPKRATTATQSMFGRICELFHAKGSELADGDPEIK